MQISPCCCKYHHICKYLLIFANIIIAFANICIIIKTASRSTININPPLYHQHHHIVITITMTLIIISTLMFAMFRCGGQAKAQQQDHQGRAMALLESSSIARSSSSGDRQHHHNHRDHLDDCHPSHNHDLQVDQHRGPGRRGGNPLEF